MTRYKIEIEYDGTAFSGWQRQENSPSVQEEIEKAIFKFSGQEVGIYGAGRTDAGVHALGQVAHFDLGARVRRGLRSDVIPPVIQRRPCADVESSTTTCEPSELKIIRSKQSLQNVSPGLPRPQGARNDEECHASSANLLQDDHPEQTPPYLTTEIIRAINYHLRKHKIVILSCEIVDRNFHARFSAKSRSYVYKIINRSAPLSIDAGKAWQIHNKLDIDAMKKAATYLVGHHDFTSFRATSCCAQSPIKTLNTIEITCIKDRVEIHISAPSFLHNMVRNITGTLVYVGLGKLKADDVRDILEAKDRTKAGITAPAEGLYFLSVGY